MAISEPTLAGDLRGSHAPTTMAAEPPAQGGIQILVATIVVHCIVTNRNDMEKIQHHSFYNELRVTPEGHPVLPTEALLNPEAKGERMTQTRDETLNVPATYVSTQAACVYSFTATTERAIARDFKENLTYIGLDYDTEHKSTDNEKICELPDGNITTVGAKFPRCTEVFFQPSFTGKEACGFLDTPLQNVTKCDVYIRKEWYATVVVSGSTAFFQGLIEHKTKKLTALAPLTRHLTEDLMKILTQRGYSFTATAEKEIVPVVKEILCYMRLDYDTELKSTAEIDKDKTYLLPDRIIITVFAERSLLRESVVPAQFTGKQASGVHHTSFHEVWRGHL